MRILILGASGMLGRKLAERLERDGTLGASPISTLSLVDIVRPTPPPGAAFEVKTLVGDVSYPGAARTAILGRPDVVFQLAAVVSGEAEDDFDTGYRVNLDGMRTVLSAIREVGGGYRPRLVFSSSIAVFGAPLPEIVGDDQAVSPLTSYGTQKAIGELLLADYTRRGFLDGVAIRLPTICVRPGAPNRAASGFVSSIIREPLNGREAILPVPLDVRHWVASPRAAVNSLLHAATIDAGALGGRRCLTMPGLSVTVEEQIAALRRIAGDDAVRLIRHEPDEKIRRIVADWPQAFDPRRAQELGFSAEASFEEIIRIYEEDELSNHPEAMA